MSLASYRSFGAEITKALGLDPNTVHRLTIDIQAGAMICVTADMYVTDEGCNGVVSYLETKRKEFILLEVEPNSNEKE